MEKRTVMLSDYWVSPLYNSKVPQTGGVNRGMQICRSLMTKIFEIQAKSKIRAQKIDESPTSAAIAGSGNPLKSRFESEIRAKIFSNSADPFACIFTPSSNLISKDLDISDVYILVKAWRLCSVASDADDYVVLAGKKICKLFRKLSCVLCFQSLIQQQKY